ncbi:uncharacterized protein PAE49_005008 isoform 1-T2 [Odontesthes bonariensis]|uniref:uncharacterized protein LOC142379883 n=1 Tax=Odontesthes bonariensis TaxID=219752 RepID=UPI003F588302
MSDDSSSDEEWYIPLKRQTSGTHRETKCWECGKPISNLKSLMTHYKSHNIKATCHICKVTFRRLISLSTHLDNAHSPPLCSVCHQSFSNVWELNKHAETHSTSSLSFQGDSSSVYWRQKNGNFSKEVPEQQSTTSVRYDSVSYLKPEQRIVTEFEGPEMSVTSMEYVMGEDDEDIGKESDCERSDTSTSSQSEVMPTNLSSTDTSDSSNSSDSEDPLAPVPRYNTEMCEKCGRGPFRSLKLHLLHCTGVRIRYRCVLCMKLFLTEAALREHQMPLNSCDVCFQVFANEMSYYSHKCPRGFKLPLVLFCPESMPKPCNVCKSFFTSDETLSLHVTNIHSSVVSTKVRIITKPLWLTDKNATTGVLGTEAKSAISSLGVGNQAINGKLRVGQNSVASLPCSSSCLVSTAASGVYRSAPSSDSPAATDPTPDTAASDPGSSSPTILALFENDSQDVALMKRLNTGWRSKAPFPCRHCGAIFRQPSFIISHRYHHRGRRSHQCQCGRAFKHRLHLLRHCVQHAEAMSYICVSCGETFTGAKVLAQHLRGKSLKKSHSGRTIKVKKKCRKPFKCDCGQQFFRPSAYIWHQLKNRVNTQRFL